MKDPIPYLHNKIPINHTRLHSQGYDGDITHYSKNPLIEYDVLFMDDGARTPRFAPYFTNTGFYFIRYNKKTLYFMERYGRCVN